MYGAVSVNPFKWQYRGNLREDRGPVMTQHHTKNSGNLGVFEVQVDLHEKGYVVSVPLTEHAPFDLVAYKDGKAVSLRVEPPENNQMEKVNFASEYLRVP